MYNFLKMAAGDFFKIKIRKKIFVSEETGFGVFSGKIEPSGEERIIVGSLFDIREGDKIEIEGEETFHPKFGKQIRVNSFKNLLPDDNEGIIRFLSSGRIKGVGRKTAEKIVNEFGKETFNAIRNHPEKLSAIKGIRRSVIERVKSSIEESRILRDLSVQLSPFGFGSTTIFRIYKEFGENSISYLNENPYRLIGKIRGIGFRRADTIAKSFKLPLTMPERIRAGIKFILEKELENKGHIFIPKKELLSFAVTLLSIGSNEIESEIEELIGLNEIVREEIPEPVYLSFRCMIVEKAIAGYLFRISGIHSEREKIDPDFSADSMLKLTDEQKEAVRTAVNSKVTIITGGPGTGKTTIIRSIIDSATNSGKTIFVAAPTGRAAKRIEEATGYQTSTIHRLLKINPESMEFIFNESNPLNADFILIDEFSMVDTFIFYHLLRAVKKECSLILIGDKDQLPPVGPGNVLRDMINSGYFKTIYLNLNFRQTEASMIIENAYRINNGKEIKILPYSENLDFVLIRATVPDIILEKTAGIIKYYREKFSYNSFDYQVLTPVYRGDAGINRLNSFIQARFNLSDFILKTETKMFKLNDKIMQLKNNYEKEVFNGEQGTLVSYEKEKGIVYANFNGNIVEYSRDELDEITLSYAISIHKSQGSEYDYLILILLPSHSMMLNRELLYTAVTRARRKLVIISDEETLKKAIANSTPNLRRTILPLRLSETFSRPRE